jgi:hypothetical protein
MVMVNRRIISIAETGTIIVPHKVRMTICEIADLFGIYCQTAKKHIRAIEKSGVAGGDNSLSCTVEGMKIYPDYYGLEMIIAVAFRVQSHNAEIFRNWILNRAVTVSVANTPEMKILIYREWTNASLN